MWTEMDSISTVKETALAINESQFSHLIKIAHPWYVVLSGFADDRTRIGHNHGGIPYHIAVVFVPLEDR